MNFLPSYSPWKIYCSVWLLITLLPIAVEAQAPPIWNAAQIHQAIKKANVLGSALYIAAHPDDENTRLISWLANDMKVEVAYLSMTRGDGGQNLIGTEMAELLGVLRTQELLAARRIDGGSQCFTRANDFGYSKSPEETLRIWNKSEVLSDVVWAIRNWKPDIIINRFDHTGSRRTHGHHTASAMLSVEAFDLAGRSDAFPEQLQYVQPHQPARLFFNTSWWFYGSREAFEAADKSDMISVDVGVYYPLLGKSNNEIAAESRSQHKCQGFGVAGSRGSQKEYLKLIKGDMPPSNNPFSGIDLSWRRVPGGAPIAELLERIDREFRPDAPWHSIPQLLQALRMIEQLPPSYWRTIKCEELREIIAACMGLFADARTNVPSATPGENVPIELEVINRSPIKVQLQQVRLLPQGAVITPWQALPENERWLLDTTLHLPREVPFTSPYWLVQPWELGMYRVEDQQLRGLPETPRPTEVEFVLSIEGTEVQLRRTIKYHYTDNVKGEQYQPFEITPPVFANLDQDVYVFAKAQPKEIDVIVRAGRDSVHGTLQLHLPQGWQVQPQRIDMVLLRKGQEQKYTFHVVPPKRQDVGTLIPVVHLNDGQSWSRKVVFIEYDHIPPQTVVLPSQARIVHIDIEKAGQRIGYIMGAGDKIPESLRQIGYEVDLIDVEDIASETLAAYDAVVLGVRACNTHEKLRFKLPELWAYARQGGTVVMQYQTTWGLKVPMEELAPYPLKLSRQRVTVEDAPVTFLAPEHPVLNYPNRITKADFEGWVQERGLYFASEWDAAYTPILASHDPGEPPRQGGLLVAPLGKGWFVYTGYSWFRELPAGVPGAFRLFANIISLGHQQ